MGLVLINKARRKKKLPLIRGDGVSKKIIRRVADAYVKVSQSLITPALQLKITRLINDGQTNKVVDLIPWYNPMDEESVKLWKPWTSKLEETLADLHGSRSKSELGKLRRGEGIFRKEEKAHIDVLPISIVPVDRASIIYARLKSSTLITDVVESQKEAVRIILEQAIQQGTRGPVVAMRIANEVGLRPDQVRALSNFWASLSASGMKEAAVQKKAKRYAKKLLRQRGELIVRSETIAAMSEGRRDGWLKAQQEGILPPKIQRKWNSAPESSNPNRPCQICLALDKAPAVGINDPWIVNVKGKEMVVMHPGGGPGGSHPGCRCDVALVQPEEEG